MQTFIAWNFWLSFIGLIATITYLCKNEYPRVDRYSASADIFRLLLMIGFQIWAADVLGYL